MPMEEIDSLVGELMTCSDQIDQVLSRAERLGEDEVAELRKIYKNRLPVLKRLNTIFSSEDGKNFINCNLDLWKKIIMPIIEKDRLQVQQIGRCNKEIGNDLRSLMKQKMLLVYTAGKKS